jgi:YVTN family beta-propeller protein
VRRATLALLVGFSLLLLGACSTAVSGKAITPSPPLASESRMVIVGIDPQNMVLNPVTHTLYAVSDPENGSDGSVSVLNASTCNALRASGCAGNTPYVQVGNGPGTIAVDQATDTIYVVNSNSNTVSVVDGATCNAQRTTGCSRTPPVIMLPEDPDDVTVNQATGTVYVSNWGNGAGTTVSVIDGKTCNAQITSGCKRVPAHVTVGTGPAGVFADQSTDTVYAATVAPGGSEAVWVINGAACNAATTAGCRRKPPSMTVGKGSAKYSVAFALDQATGTLYVTNWADNTLSMIDKTRCNATVTSGCAQPAHVVRVGHGPDGVAIDSATHTVYVANVTSNTVSVFDAATCNATVSSGCGTSRSRLLRTGNAPKWVAADQDTNTVYVSNGDDGTASVLNGATCNATVVSGCH